MGIASLCFFRNQLQERVRGDAAGFYEEVLKMGALAKKLGIS